MEATTTCVEVVDTVEAATVEAEVVAAQVAMLEATVEASLGEAGKSSS